MVAEKYDQSGVFKVLFGGEGVTVVWDSVLSRALLGASCYGVAYTQGTSAQQGWSVTWEPSSVTCWRPVASAFMLDKIKSGLKCGECIPRLISVARSAPYLESYHPHLVACFSCSVFGEWTSWSIQILLRLSAVRTLVSEKGDWPLCNSDFV